MGKFFSDPAWATWAQTFIVTLSVIVAILTLRDTDANSKTANSMTFVQRYYLDKPALSVSAASMRAMQYNTVQEAKKLIENYNQEANIAAGWGQLFEKARPLVAKKIKASADLVRKYEDITRFFQSVIFCSQSQVCDKDVLVKLIAPEMLAYYNAVCPYMEYTEISLNNEDESPQFLGFLVNVAGYKKF